MAIVNIMVREFNTARCRITKGAVKLDIGNDSLIIYTPAPRSTIEDAMLLACDLGEKVSQALLDMAAIQELEKRVPF